MEEDPFNPDDWVPAEVHFPQDFDSWNCVVYKDIGEYVDGSDNQAEFYVIKYDGGNSTVHAYD